MATQEQVAQDFSGPLPSFVSAPENFIANLARSGVQGLAEPLQKYNQIIGATDTAADLGALRREMATNEPGDVLPTNPELDQTFSAGLGRGLGRTSPGSLVAIS